MRGEVPTNTTRKFGSSGKNTPEGGTARTSGPSKWELKTISELVGPDGVFCDGDWIETKDQDPKGDVRLIQLADLGDGQFRNKSSRFLTSAKAKELRCTYLIEGDVLIARMPDPLGRACIFPGDSKPSVTAVDVCIVRSGNGEFDHRWLSHFVNSPEFRRTVSALQSGSTRKRISRKNLGQIKLPVPPLNEQLRIVAEIDKHFTWLDVGVAAVERAQANLKRYRASVLKAACEGRLVPTEAELAREQGRDYETGEQLLERILAERRETWKGRGKYKEPAPPDTADLANLPEGWTWAKLDALATVKGGITVNRGRRRQSNMRSVPYLRVANVQRGYFDLSEMKQIDAPEDKISELSLKSGDILLNEGGDRDKLGRGWVWNGEIPECIFQNHVFRARLFDSAVHPKFISFYANSIGQTFFLESGTQTTNLASISSSKLRELPVPLPPADEQRRIIAEIERHLSVADEVEAALTANHKRAARLRQSILQKAFEGRLVESVPERTVQRDKVEKKPARAKRHFRRAVLAAEIVDRLHKEPTFGRVKFQKVLHLCEHIAQLEEIQGDYRRKAAGPLDNKLVYACEDELRKQRWFEAYSRKGFGRSYRPLEKAGAHREYFERYWSSRRDLIERLIELVREWPTERCEIFSTAYAAWNDLLIWGQKPTNDAILREILERWTDSKKTISRKRWRNAIEWMRDKGFAPTGFGRATTGSENEE